MDEERKIRFLLPPLFMMASIIWGVRCDPKVTLDGFLRNLSGVQEPSNVGVGVVQEPSNVGVGDMLVLLAGGGVVAVTFGFLLGTLTIFVLRTTFWFFCGKYHEVFVSQDALNKIWKQIGVNDPENQPTENELFAVATFDHEILKGSDKRKGIHLWLLRRWNAFNISATSTTGLIVSVFIGKHLDVSITCNWLVPVIFVAGLFVWSSIISFQDTMRMIEFQAKRPDALPKTTNAADDGETGGGKEKRVTEKKDKGSA